jgi:hypothetical protein
MKHQILIANGMATSDLRSFIVLDVQTITPRCPGILWI